MDAVTSALRIATGNTVASLEADYNPATKLWGAPYPITVPEYTGGYVTVGQLGQWTALFVQSTTANLQAINAATPDADIVLLCLVTDGGAVRWGELDSPIGTTLRNKLNTWLAARALTLIPSGTLLRVVVRQIFRHFHNRFELDGSTDLG